MKISPNVHASSPESGAKISMYKQLQDEIRQEALSKSHIDPQASPFEAMLGARSRSPTKNYEFAESQAHGALSGIAGTSARPDVFKKRINPYDCFRSGEQR